MFRALVFITQLLASVSLVKSHATMIYPPQRGVLNGFEFSRIPIYDPKATVDWFAHFPAGDKNPQPGSALRSQKREAGWRGWNPYEPTRKGFRFRAGVCGDLKWRPEHLRGGRYYNRGRVTATLIQGGILSVDLAVTTHHNGFVELRLCDVQRCGGEISEECLRGKHCYLLKRAWDASCESRRDRGCAPIDRAYPSRWYLPCSSGGTDIYGRGKIRYRLPPKLVCEHCVLQWYWVSANSCNPPGVVAFFKSNRSPLWGNCPGQGEARGGWRRWEALCEGKRFTEEYYQCADVRVRSKSRKQPITAKKPVTRRRSSGPIRAIEFYADGASRQSLFDGQTANIDTRRYKKLTFVVNTFRRVRSVDFYFNDKKWWVEKKLPYVFGGETGKKYNSWNKPWFNRGFKLQVRAEGSKMTVFIKLWR